MERGGGGAEGVGAGRGLGQRGPSRSKIKVSHPLSFQPLFHICLVITYLKGCLFYIIKYTLHIKIEQIMIFSFEECFKNEYLT